MNSSRLKSASSVCCSAAKWTAANWSRSPSFSRQNCDTCARPLDLCKLILVERCVMKRSSHNLTAVEPIVDIENAITTLLRYIGEDPSRDGLRDKLARLVECFARRLQIQERMTRQIAEAIETHLEARGAAVILRAHHLCMGCRGVRQEETEMVTSCMLGTLRSDATSRSEFLCNAK